VAEPVTLPPRQMQLLRILAKGGKIKDAAIEAGIAEQTAKNHLRFAYRTLGVNSLVQAYVVLGWLCVPEEGS
jgi:DNA-binding NarL/FixJ family response regulator